MRRSKAPSALKKLKEVEQNITRVEPEEQYDWGSRNSKCHKSNQNKRVFSVMWRDVSTKKHKTWKGDGILEIDNLHFKAILKDEAGRFLGSLTRVDISALVPDFQMIMSGKEVEIQNEIKNEEELHNLRKIQTENWATEGFISLKDKTEEEKKPKGGFKFKPILLLKSPKVAPVERETDGRNLNVECITSKIENQSPYIRNESNDNGPSSSSTARIDELICFLRPSELQQFLFQEAMEYISSFKSNEGFDITYVLKLVCNHPSFINHKTTSNELLRHLIPFLPDWTEMGPFDSGKLEFVQYFLTDLTKSNQQICIILTKNVNVLNMLQGLCDFTKIKYLRLYSNTPQSIEQQVLNFCSSRNHLTSVILMNSMEMLSYIKFADFDTKIVVFEEYFEITKYISFRSLKPITIYYLVTAFSIEELLLLNTFNNQYVGDLLDDLLNVSNQEYDGCYLHSKIECNCFKAAEKNVNEENAFIKNWKHFEPPFDMELLKISELENSAENIVSIFCKRN